MPPPPDPREVELESLALEAMKSGDREAMEMADNLLRQLRQTQAPAPKPTSPPVNITQAVTPAPKQPGMLARLGGAIRDQFDSEVGGLARGVGEMFGVWPDDAPPNAQDLDRQGRAEALTSRAVNSFTLGGVDAAITPDLPRGKDGVPYPTRAETLRKDHKWASLVGDITGAVAGGFGGGGRVVGEALTRGVTKVAPKLVAKAGAKLGRTGSQMAAGAGTAAAETAVQNTVEGRDPTANMSLPLAFAAGVPLFGRGVEELARIPRMNRWIKRYREGVANDEYAPPVDPTAKTEDAGRFPLRDPEPAVQPGEYVQGERIASGREAADKAVHRFAERRGELVNDSRRELAEKRAPHLQTPISRKAMREDIKRQIKENQDPADGSPIDRELDRVLKDELSRTKLTRAKPGAPKGGPGLLDADGKPIRRRPERETIPDSTLEAVIRRRQVHKSQSDYGSPMPSDSAKLARKRAKIARSAIRRNAPQEVVDAEREAFARAKKLERDEDIVFRTEAEVVRGKADDVAPREAGPDADVFDVEDLPPVEIDEAISALRKSAERQAAEGKPDMRVAKEIAGSDFFKRIDDKTEPGQRVARLLKELETRDPEGYAKIVDFVRSAKARDATKFSLSSEVETQLPKLLAFGGPTGAQLLRWFGGRVAEPGLREGGQALGRLPAGRMVPFLRNPVDAIEESRRRKEETKKNAQ